MTKIAGTDSSEASITDGSHWVRLPALLLVDEGTLVSLRCAVRSYHQFLDGQKQWSNREPAWLLLEKLPHVGSRRGCAWHDVHSEAFEYQP